MFAHREEIGANAGRDREALARTPLVAHVAGVLPASKRPAFAPEILAQLEPDGRAGGERIQIGEGPGAVPVQDPPRRTRNRSI